MTPVALIRHGRTDWNESGRIQGRHDRRLSPAGRAEVASWRLPAEFEGYRWVASPLVRAVETARLLGAPLDLATDDRLVEMDWGAWEGLTLKEIRASQGAAMTRNEARGLDFRAEGGESPREVQARVADWFADVAHRGAPTLAVAHKGVIRAAYALATGWDMMAGPDGGLRWQAAHLFVLDGAGAPRVERLNIALDGT